MSLDLDALLDEVHSTRPPLPATLAELDPGQRHRIERHARHLGVSDREALAGLRVAELTHTVHREASSELDELVASLR